MNTVLITGSSGLIAKAVKDQLESLGIKVKGLSRKPKGIWEYAWNPAKAEMDERALDGVTHILHLAGAGVFDKRWDENYKKELIQSRVDSLHFLLRVCERRNHRLEALISSSGVAFYGADTGDTVVKEESPAGKDFLSSLTIQWEAAADRWLSMADRVVKIRTGIVLDTKGGALPKLMQPIRFGLGAALGSGKQWVPWIHIRDMVGIYQAAIENKGLTGVYNGCAPNPVRQKHLTSVLCKAMHRPFLLPPVPGFVLKWMVGAEAAIYLLGGNRCSMARLQASGFVFEYTTIEEAVEDLIRL